MTINPISSLFVAQRPSTSPSTPRGTWGNYGETRGGVGKRACCSTKVAISLKYIQTDQKLIQRVHRNSPTLFRTLLEGRLQGRRNTETEENATELVIEDKTKKYGLCSTKRTDTRQIKLAQIKMEASARKGRIQMR